MYTLTGVLGPDDDDEEEEEKEEEGEEERHDCFLENPKSPFPLQGPRFYSIDSNIILQV